ncbi:hypothetical protein SAMN05216256_10358 [Halopseudomonas pachastrellae]|nr:hypothetical protein SAMN05216256_10358 [Halopseudomonas pachastrellae]
MHPACKRLKQSTQPKTELMRILSINYLLDA